VSLSLNLARQSGQYSRFSLLRWKLVKTLHCALTIHSDAKGAMTASLAMIENPNSYA